MQTHIHKSTQQMGNGGSQRRSKALVKFKEGTSEKQIEEYIKEYADLVPQNAGIQMVPPQTQFSLFSSH